jgi:hypothetical protein
MVHIKRHKRKIYSKPDSLGRVYVDCSECNRGGNGNDKDKCSCGHFIKRGGKGGCFCGDPLPHVVKHLAKERN